MREYLDKAVADARERGYVTTRMGRRRYLPDINSRNAVVRGYAERNAVNAPIQGSAADIIKVAMVRIYAEMQRRSLRSRMIMQVHDELIFNVVPEELDELKRIVFEGHGGRICRSRTARSGRRRRSQLARSALIRAESQELRVKITNYQLPITN